MIENSIKRTLDSIDIMYMYYLVYKHEVLSEKKIALTFF